MSKAKMKRTLISVLKYITLILGGFVSVLPIVVCVITAFKTPEEYASTNVMTLPQSWLYFENFIQAWSQANMGVAFRNSGICTGWFYSDWFHACLCAEPFQIQRQWFYPKSVPVCFPASRHCYAGICISDYVQPWMD